MTCAPITAANPEFSSEVTRGSPVCWFMAVSWYFHPKDGHYYFTMATIRYTNVKRLGRRFGDSFGDGMAPSICHYHLRFVQHGSLICDECR